MFATHKINSGIAPISELVGPTVGLAIIRFISQIPMLIWLRTMVEL